MARFVKNPLGLQATIFLATLMCSDERSKHLMLGMSVLLLRPKKNLKMSVRAKLGNSCGVSPARIFQERMDILA